MYEAPEYHPAFEEYCETIFELAEDDVAVIQARIAERLDVSRPAVSEMIKRMESGVSDSFQRYLWEANEDTRGLSTKMAQDRSTLAVTRQGPSSRHR